MARSFIPGLSTRNPERREGRLPADEGRPASDPLHPGPGPDRYGGDFEIAISTPKKPKIWQPSRLLNTVLLNVPRYVASWLQGANDQRRQWRTRLVRLRERVLIPRELHNEIVPEGPDGDIAAIEEVNPGDPLPGRPLNVTADDFRTHKIFSLGPDHEKAQVLPRRGAGETGRR